VIGVANSGRLSRRGSSDRRRADPRIAAASCLGELPRRRDHHRVVALQRQRRKPHHLARELVATSSGRRFTRAIGRLIGWGTLFVRPVWHLESHYYCYMKPTTLLSARRS
jgi:hypothetical protein